MAKKIVLIILGILLLLCGLGALAGGGGLLSAVGTNGTLRSGFHRISTDTPAYRTDPNALEDKSNVQVSGSGVTLTVEGRSASARPLFIGVGRTADVDAYLDGVSVDEISKLSFSPFKITTETVPGNDQASPPTARSFWVARATGTDALLSWKLADGNYSLVVMNADGSPGVALDARVGVRAKALSTVAIVGLICGAIVVLLGLGALIWGIRSKRRTPPAVAYPGAYPGASSGPYPPSGPPQYQPGSPYPPSTYPPSTYPPSAYPSSTPPSSQVPPSSTAPPPPPPTWPPSTPPSSAPPSAPPSGTSAWPPSAPPDATTPSVPPWSPAGGTQPPSDPTAPPPSSDQPPTTGTGWRPAPPRSDGEPPYGDPPPWSKPPTES